MSVETLPWNLDAPADFKPEPPPTGTRLEQARVLLARAKKRDARAQQAALDAERAGDEQGCWFAMAQRKQNQRFIDQLEADIAKLVSAACPLPP